MNTKTIATAAATITALYDEHGVDIWWIDEAGQGDHIEWHKAQNPTIKGRVVEDGEVLDEGQWDLDEAEDIIRSNGWATVGPWDFSGEQPTIEVEKA